MEFSGFLRLLVEESRRVVLAGFRVRRLELGSRRFCVIYFVFCVVYERRVRVCSFFLFIMAFVFFKEFGF